ncbi:MAG TPA: xanthine dehydrogenase family protein subunit M [Bryobacteraceae bacterium]|nr:xanthine dehydrogenase family protein subunit M [Bryobacteraceae bacterium]
MQNFEHASPSTLKEATALLGASWADAQVLAGGTDLISLMKDYVETPRRVVNIKNIKELNGISANKTGVRIGALVTFEELGNHAAIRTQFPSLVTAVRGVTSPQIRNMGTVAGDLCQRPRCWYYRTGNGLLGIKDGKSLVQEGENRYHAIFASGPAFFVSASSLGPALVALGAKVKLVSATGSREVDAAKFFVAPANETSREIALQPNEIVSEILIPVSGVKNATYEVREKDALDWPLATASVALRMKGSAIESGQVVLGHVAATPWVASQASGMLAGKIIDEKVAEQIGQAAVEGAKPLRDNGYKVQLARVAVKRALLEAVGKKAV